MQLEKSLEELLDSKEDLYPELQEYYEPPKNKRFAMLRHPLVCGVPYTPMMNGVYNAQFKYKTQALEDAWRDKKWGTYVWLHERYSRWEAFYKIEGELNDQEYWEILGDIWTDSENIYQFQSLAKHFISARRLAREFIMTEDEQQTLAKLPDEIRIYRGHDDRNKSGLSWTLSYGMAKWFATRYDAKRAKVDTGICKKKDVIALFLGRNEFEIVVNPCYIENLETVKKLRRPKWLQAILDQCIQDFALKGPRSYHGPAHWDKVERNAIILAQAVPGADMKVCRAFAVIHDCKRANEDHDPEHGLRAAVFANYLDSKDAWTLNRAQVDKLAEACQYHNDGKTTTDPTIGVCWDADRLDLSRVGIAPDPQLLSTDAAKQLIWKI